MSKLSHLEKEICEMYLEGKSSYKIERMLGIYSSTILRILKKNNINIRKRPMIQHTEKEEEYVCEIKDPRYIYCHKSSCQKHKECYEIFNKIRKESEDRNKYILSRGKNFQFRIRPESPLMRSPIFKSP